MTILAGVCLSDTYWFIVLLENIVTVILMQALPHREFSI